MIPVPCVAYASFEPQNEFQSSAVTRYFDFPSKNELKFFAVSDPSSGFLNLKRTFGVPDNDSIIVNEGIALSSYYSGNGYRPGLEIEWKTSSEICLYFLFSGNNFLTLSSDLDKRVTKYKGKRKTRIVPSASYLYFYSPVPVETEIIIRGISYPFQSILTEPGKVCIETICQKQQRFFENVEEGGGMIRRIPFPEWKDVFWYIQKFYKERQKPIPLAPLQASPVIEVEIFDFNASMPFTYSQETGDTVYRSMFSSTVNLRINQQGIVETSIPIQDDSQALQPVVIRDSLGVLIPIAVFTANIAKVVFVIELTGSNGQLSYDLDIMFQHRLRGKYYNTKSYSSETEAEEDQNGIFKIEFRQIAPSDDKITISQTRYFNNLADISFSIFSVSNTRQPIFTNANLTATISYPFIL